MKKIYVLASGVLMAILALGLTALTPTLAHEGEEHTNDRAATAHERAEHARQAAQDRTEQLRQEVAQKLSEAKKRACEQREQNINRIVQRSSTQAEKHLGVFQTIEDRVKQFADDNNLSPENYDTLVAAADDAELAAVEAIEATDVTTFDCDDEGTGRQFSNLVRTTVQDMHQALKDYRTALVDLIKGVKQSTEGTEAEGEEES